jgi:hypothetical protein
MPKERKGKERKGKADESTTSFYYSSIRPLLRLKFTADQSSCQRKQTKCRNMSHQCHFMSHYVALRRYFCELQFTLLLSFLKVSAPIILETNPERYFDSNGRLHFFLRNRWFRLRFCVTLNPSTSPASSR